MILTSRRLEEFGRALYGEIWIPVMARKLRRSKRTILRWKSDDGRMPPDLRRTVLDLIDTQIAVLAEKRRELLDQ